MTPPTGSTPVAMSRPAVKPEHAPYRIADGRIRLGGVVFGIAAEVVDPTGAMWTLLQSMDGTRTVDQIVDRVLEEHPHEAPDTLRACVERFIGSGYVEDAGAPVPCELTERDIVRYDRSRRFFRWIDLTSRESPWYPQIRLRRAAVTVVGLGGTGGTAALALAGSGVGRLHCVDFDVVELSNLNRQLLYTEQDIGQPKVDAGVRRLRALNADIEITGESLDVAGVADARRLAEGCDVLLLCADTPRDTRTWTNRGCVAAGTPWVDAGYHGPLTQVATYLPARSACWECVQHEGRERHRSVGARSLDGAELRRATHNSVSAVSAGVSGHLAAHAVISLLTGIPPLREGTIHTVNLYDLTAPPLVVGGERWAECPACGDPGGGSQREVSPGGEGMVSVDHPVGAR
jgi:molybdopterin-synthase adenylyltransferase